MLEFAQTQPGLTEVVRACINNYRERLDHRQHHRFKIELRQPGNLLHYEFEVFVRDGMPKIRLQVITAAVLHIPGLVGSTFQLPQ